MQSIHDRIKTGHDSSMKMYHSAVRRFWWPGMYSHFGNYVNSCEISLAANKEHCPNIALNPYQLRQNVLKLYIYAIDLLSIFTPSHKYKHMLVMIDSFSKFVIVKV